MNDVDEDLLTDGHHCDRFEAPHTSHVFTLMLLSAQCYIQLVDLIIRFKVGT